MNKISNKNIHKMIYSAGTLAILALAVSVMPAVTYAAFDGAVSRVDGYSFNDISGPPVVMPNYISTPVYIQTPVVVPAPVAVATPTPILYSSSSGGNPRVAVAVRRVAPNNITIVTSSVAPDSSLAANAINGSNSFMPSGLIQWIFFILLVLLVVVLARKIFSARKNYPSTPIEYS